MDGWNGSCHCAYLYVVKLQIVLVELFTVAAIYLDCMVVVIKQAHFLAFLSFRFTIMLHVSYASTSDTNLDV